MNLDFERATRDRRIEALRLKPRVTLLVKAVDRIAQAMIVAGESGAYVDDGQQLVAEIPINRLAEVMQRSPDTVSRAIMDASEIGSPVEVEPQTGRSYLFVLHWRQIPQLGHVDAQPPASCGGCCGGSQAELRGVAGGVAGGRTSNFPEKQGGPQHPPQNPRVRERDLFQLRDSVYRVRESGGAGGETCDVSGCGESDLGGCDGFFEPETSGDLPWQRLTDEQLRTLEPTMVAVLYVESVKSRKVVDSHDARKRFLAACWHCARSRTIEGRRALVLVGRVRKRNYLGLMDSAWKWAGEQMDITRVRGAGAYLNAAMRAWQRQCDVSDPVELN